MKKTKMEVIVKAKEMSARERMRHTFSIENGQHNVKLTSLSFVDSNYSYYQATFLTEEGAIISSNIFPGKRIVTAKGTVLDEGWSWDRLSDALGASNAELRGKCLETQLVLMQQHSATIWVAKIGNYYNVFPDEASMQRSIDKAAEKAAIANG